MLQSFEEKKFLILFYVKTVFRIRIKSIRIRIRAQPFAESNPDSTCSQTC